MHYHSPMLGMCQIALIAINALVLIPILSYVATPVIVPVGGNALSVSVGEDVSLHFDIVRANPPVLKDNITWVISTSSGQKTLKCGNITRYVFPSPPLLQFYIQQPNCRF